RKSEAERGPCRTSRRLMQARRFMQAMLGTVFGLLLAAQIVVLVWSGALLARFPSLLWSRSPWTAGIAGGLLLALAVLFWRSRKARRAAATAPDIPRVHPGIS